MRMKFSEHLWVLGMLLLGVAHICVTVKPHDIASTLGSVECPNGFTQVGEQCLLLLGPRHSNDGKNAWQKAQTICKQRGGRLAELPDTTAIVIDYINGEGGWYFYWVGANKDTDGVFRWRSSMKIVNNWESGEPNNGGSGPDEDCVSLVRATGKYNDDTCGRTAAFICEAGFASDSGGSCGIANTKRIVDGSANTGNEDLRRVLIQGGLEVEFPRKYPWMVMISIEKDGITYKCGGSIINDRHILTAAHCFYIRDGHCRKMNPTKVTAVIGEHNRHNKADNDDNFKEHSVRLDWVFIPDEYSCYYRHNDIAILRLGDPIPFNDVIRPICLPEDDTKTYVLQTAKVTGWGLTSERGNTPATLREVDIPILNTTCDGYRTIRDFQLCAGDPVEGGKGACQGDSGGPLTVMENAKYVQVGIVSYAIGCAKKNEPGVYTRVSKYLDWINDISASG